MLYAVTFLLVLVLVAISVVDMRTFRIPDMASLPLMASGLLVAVGLPVMPFWHHAVGIIAGFGLFAVIGEVYFRRRGEDGLGLGDAKLFGAAGAWLGWQMLPMVLLIAALGGLAFALVRGGNGRVAFGPWLALGFGLAWYAQRFAGWSLLSGQQ